MFSLRSFPEIYVSSTLAWKWQTGKSSRERKRLPETEEKTKLGLSRGGRCPSHQICKKAKSSNLIYKLMIGKILLPVDTADP